eukprot:gene15236-23270_t
MAAQGAADVVVHSISNLYTMDRGAGDKSLLGRVEDGAVAFKGNRVLYVGPTRHAPKGTVEIDGKGYVGFPGLVDCHTHTVHAGSRADEFGRRLAGAAYTEILEAGGGILSTVNATRAATEDELAESCRQRLQRMVARGVTTVEIKSGYGLTAQDELKMLKAAARCRDVVRVVTTFLGAHTTPQEWRDHPQGRQGYVRDVLENQLPLVARYADAIDVYCDKGAFTLEEAVQILKAGKAAGLKVKAHSEQVAYTGIAEAAAKLGAVSVDHLERLDDAGVKAMKDNGTVAVCLPGAQLYLRDTPPPVDLLRAAGVPIAVATDLNPGTSPVHDLWLCATMSCITQGLTMEEALLGITKNAGLALGEPTLGWLSTSSVADMSLQKPPPGEPPIMQSILQHMTGHSTHCVIRDVPSLEDAQL